VHLVGSCYTDNKAYFISAQVLVYYIRVISTNSLVA